MQSIVFISLALLFVVIKADNRTASYISAHDFLFISGWPQSGTSLLQQILSVSPASSTLIEKCSQYVKKSSCVNWNYEGQWALKFFPGDRARSASHAVSLLNAGSMCQGTSKYQERILNDQSPQKRREKYPTYLHDAVYHITQTWGTMWNLEKKLLVEKSPQSMLKTEFLREVFKEANSIKFLIVLKVYESYEHRMFKFM
jgi:Sulfotransferase family